MTGFDIATIRHSLGLTQAQMAQMLGISKNALSAIERDAYQAREPVKRLLEAIRDGYRPKDWPGARRRAIADHQV